MKINYLFLFIFPFVLLFSCEEAPEESAEINGVESKDTPAVHTPIKDTTGMSTLEKDALIVGDLMCKTRGYVARLNDGNEKAIKDLEVFENENEVLLRSTIEKYPIHTAEGVAFNKLVNEHLENCEFNPL